MYISWFHKIILHVQSQNLYQISCVLLSRQMLITHIKSWIMISSLKSHGNLHTHLIRQDLITSFSKTKIIEHCVQKQKTTIKQVIN